MMTRLTIATALITATFALTAWTSLPRTGDMTAPKAGKVTEIQKNQIWPIKGRISMDPCALSACQEV